MPHASAHVMPICPTATSHGGAVPQPPPCKHNDWDDVRQQKGVKVLRCRVCNQTWRWPRGVKRGYPGLRRCLDFLNDRCLLGERCMMLHMRKKKQSLAERVETFGADILTRVTVKREGAVPPSPSGSHSSYRSSRSSYMAESELGSFADSQSQDETFGRYCMSEEEHDDIISTLWHLGAL